MMSDCKDLEIIERTRTPYQVWCFKNVGTLGYEVHNYRKNFLKRKNINSYKKCKKGTPVIIDKMINAFDRKICNKKIFTDDIKQKYLDGLNEIFESYYYHLKYSQVSRKSAYRQYCADVYCHNLGRPMCYESFMKTGRWLNYR